MQCHFCHGLTNGKAHFNPCLLNLVGFQPVFQNSKSSNQFNHSLSVLDSSLIARLSRASLLTDDSEPFSKHSCHSTCICLIRRFASSGLSKFLSHMSRNSSSHVRPSLVIGSITRLDGFDLPKGHHPMLLRETTSFELGSSNVWNKVKISKVQSFSEDYGKDYYSCPWLTERKSTI